MTNASKKILRPFFIQNIKSHKKVYRCFYLNPFIFHWNLTLVFPLYVSRAINRRWRIAQNLYLRHCKVVNNLDKPLPMHHPPNVWLSLAKRKTICLTHLSNCWTTHSMHNLFTHVLYCSSLVSALVSSLTAETIHLLSKALDHICLNLPTIHIQGWSTFSVLFFTCTFLRFRSPQFRLVIVPIFKNEGRKKYILTCFVFMSASTFSYSVVKFTRVTRGFTYLAMYILFYAF